MNSDWMCNQCNFHNFADRIVCLKCENNYTKKQETNLRINQAPN